MKSNCLWYALDQWVTIGGAIRLVHSTHWCIPHVQHIAPDGTLTQFVPPRPLAYPWLSLMGFVGVIEVGDKDAARRGVMHPLCVGLGSLLLIFSGAGWLVARSWRRLWTQK